MDVDYLNVFYNKLNAQQKIDIDTVKNAMTSVTSSYDAKMYFSLPNQMVPVRLLFTISWLNIAKGKCEFAE